MKSYIEELQAHIHEELRCGERLDFSTRIAPVLMMNGKIYCSDFSQDCYTKQDYPKTHSEIIISLIEDETLTGIKGCYDYHREREEMEEEDEMENYAFGHLIRDMCGDEIIVWEDSNIKGYATDLIDAISDSENPIEHFFIDKENFIRDLGSFCLHL